MAEYCGKLRFFPDGEINRQGAIMYYSNVVISYLQANKILAMKLDRAVSGIEQRVSGQVKTIGAGVTRILYYTSCFTDEYQDVCKKQKNEDVRFAKGIYHLLQRKNNVYEMLKIYFEEIFKHKTTEQLEHIKRILMAVNIHIAADSLTKSGFVLATATCVSVGMKLSLDMGAIAGRSAGAPLQWLACMVLCRGLQIALSVSESVILHSLLYYTNKNLK